MKFLNAIIFYTGVSFFLIGIYEAMVLGIGSAYGIFMVSLVLLFIYVYRKNHTGDSKK